MKLQEDADFIIAKQKFCSRLMIGTGKYANLDIAKKSVVYSGAEIVTVAIRRLQTLSSNIINQYDWGKLWLLPNTAGCSTVEEAIRVAQLGREINKRLGQADNNFIKLEVIADTKYLLPDPIGTLKAAEFLVNKGFAVLPYIGQDPMLAKQLEEIGCATVMPLGSPIGSGQGIVGMMNLRIIIENSTVPVIIDAGIGTASDVIQAMEIGADAVLINSAIAKSKSPCNMAASMKKAVEAGRLAYLSGRMNKYESAHMSSPITGLVY